MIRSILIFLLFIVLSGCDNQAVVKTPTMAEEARNTVLAYLTKNKLPHQGLELFESNARPKPDFGFLYKGAGRCIEIVIYCHGQSCKDRRSYPYDEHGEKCP